MRRDRGRVGNPPATTRGVASGAATRRPTSLPRIPGASHFVPIRPTRILLLHLCAGNEFRGIFCRKSLSRRDLMLSGRPAWETQPGLVATPAATTTCSGAIPRRPRGRGQQGGRGRARRLVPTALGGLGAAPGAHSPRPTSSVHGPHRVGVRVGRRPPPPAQLRARAPPSPAGRGSVAGASASPV
jgi:hypothetical protein